MHLRQKSRYLPSQLWCEVHLGTAAWLTVVQRAARNLAAEHFFKAHRLSAELKRILCVLFWFPTLVLYGIGQPQPLTPFERDTDFTPVKFQHVARAGNAERTRENTHIARDDEISSAFRKRAVVGIFVKDRSVSGAEIFRPLVLNVNERPLAAAELEVLQTGELEEVLLIKVHQSLLVPIQAELLQ